MSYKISDLHPVLQEKISELKNLCLKENIKIGIGECLRTAEEHEALFNQGRSGDNAPVVSSWHAREFRSMHQWGVAFDFYLEEGNQEGDSLKIFEHVGDIGKSIGLMWGGDFKTRKDINHFQLSNWMEDPIYVLLKTYGEPDTFIRRWSGENTAIRTMMIHKETEHYSRVEFEPAEDVEKRFAGDYKTTTSLDLKSSPGKESNVTFVVPKGKIVTTTGRYTVVDNLTWVLITYKKYSGYVPFAFIQRK